LKIKKPEGRGLSKNSGKEKKQRIPKGGKVDRRGQKGPGREIKKQREKGSKKVP